ncbi:MAG: thioredoxin domain-containing protein [Myxococcaceae bacterium]
MSHRLLAGPFLAIAALACTSPSTTTAKPTAPEGQDPKAPAARIDGQAITYGELEDLVKGDLRRMETEHRERVHQLRKAALDNLIVRRVLDAKAKAAGKSPEDLLRAEVSGKVGEPSDGEVRALYERAKAAGQANEPLDKMKPAIANYIKQQKTQEALRSYYERLREEAKVEVLLPPYRAPKVEVAAEGPSRGPANAPVTIVEFSDFQCPYCSRAEGVVTQVLDLYKDKVRLVYRDYPLPFHENAVKAAEAAHCAGDQGKYWEMHGKLFANQASLDPKALKAHARDLKLDGSKFDKCLDSGEKAKVVEASRKAGEEAGVNGTPAFFVNGRMISGAQPLESFKAVIDPELAQK